MKRKFIQYEKLQKREQDLKRLEKQGFKFLHSKSNFKQIVGIGCLIVAVVPNGLGLVFYPIGFYLLKINKVDIYRHKENLLRKVKCFIQMKGGFKK